MTEESTEKTIAKFTFSGKSVDWPVWSEKFLARARRKDYKKILLGTEVVPSDTTEIDESTDAGKKEKKLRELNENAYEELILFVDGNTEAGRVAFSIIRGAKTKRLKDGDANLAWIRLCNKYRSKSAPSRLNLKNKFTAMKLKNVKSDPDIWLTELEDLRLQLEEAGATMSEEDVMEHALNNLPDAYENVVAKLEDRIGDSTNPLTIGQLREQLNLKFERLKGKRTIDSTNEEGETALFAGGFKGKCNKCGRYGHKARDCRSGNTNNNNNNNNNNNSGTRKINGSCFYCGKKGHMKKDCFKKKRDDEAKKNDQANVGTDDDHEDELVLIGLEEK